MNILLQKLDVYRTNKQIEKVGMFFLFPGKSQRTKGYFCYEPFNHGRPFDDNYESKRIKGHDQSYVDSMFIATNKLDRFLSNDDYCRSIANPFTSSCPLRFLTGNSVYTQESWRVRKRNFIGRKFNVEIFLDSASLAKHCRTMLQFVTTGSHDEKCNSSPCSLAHARIFLTSERQKTPRSQPGEHSVCKELCSYRHPWIFHLCCATTFSQVEWQLNFSCILVVALVSFLFLRNGTHGTGTTRCV